LGRGGGGCGTWEGLKNGDKNWELEATKTGWWYTYPSEKYEFLSRDYYSQYIIGK
jgi:hypothetical protein